MKIQPINNFILFKSKGSVNTVEPEQSNANKNNAMQQVATVGAGVGAIIGGLLIHKNIKIHKAEKALEEIFAAKFPKDVEYRKELLKAIGIPENKWMSIRSIIGGQEYKSIVSEFADAPEAYTPGKSLLTDVQDGYDLTGIFHRDFRISLHNHTIKSDGKMTVQELLDQAASYADEVAKVNKGKMTVLAEDSPFTIAITDHDTVDGCKEAVKIIAANPEKYKNLRVVFGTELSVENRVLGNNLTKPVPIHMVVNCINPFDKNLNDFLDTTKVARKDVAVKFFEEFRAELQNTQVKDVASRLSMDEAREFSATLEEGLNYPWYYLKEYVKTKITPEEEKAVLVTLGRVQSRFEPKLDLQKYCMDMSDAMDTIAKQEYGYMTIAHPALTPIGSCIKNPHEAFKHLTTLISLFKVRGGEKALATELYYPYFGDVARSKDWLEMITKATLDNKLLPSGGLDSHGKNIFYSNI